MTRKHKCASCIHCEMCKWIDEVHQDGCDFYAEPCEDCVSREAAKAVVKKHFGQSIPWTCQPITEDLDALPPVQPKEKIGHWIYDYTSADGHKTYHCSECGCYLQPKHSEPLNSFKRCSLCGAKMKGEKKC